jgi:PAS domain S-box-containing protein
MSVEEILTGEPGHAALSLLGKLVQAPLYLLDLRRFELVWSSRPLESVLDLDAAQLAEIARTGIVTVLHPADLARLPELRERHASLADGELLEGDFRVRGKDGSWQWLHTREVVAERDAEGRPTRLLGSAQNVTQARRLAEQRALLHAAVQHTDETVVVTTPDGVIAYVNPAFERVTGYRRDEVLGRHVRVLKSGEHDREFYRRLWDVLLRGDTWRGPFVNRRKDGTTFREEATISPVRDQAGTVTHFIAVKRDLSREEHLQGQLAQARRLEVVGRLTASVAHDFNNVLSAILGFSSLVLGGLPDESPLESDVQEIVSAARRAQGLTQQLLALTREQEPAPCAIELASNVTELKRMLQRLVREHTILEIEAHGEPLLVRMDPVQLQQVLLNLVVNASDAMPRGGRLAIVVAERTHDRSGRSDPSDRASHADRDGPGTPREAARASAPAGAPPAGRWAVIEVRDCGDGMTEEVQRRMFEPFFTTKRAADASGEAPKGTGLGLATVQRIVQHAGGQIRVRSEVGVGTTFSVFLPIVQAARTVAAPPEARVRRSERIWIVEGDPQVRAIAARALQAIGYRASVFESGHAVLAAARLARLPDLMICDVGRADGEGVELARAIRARCPSQRILFLSAHLASRVALPDDTSFLAKPFSLDELARTVRRALEGHVAEPSEPRLAVAGE